MTGRRCHCGCRALLERCNVRTHARYASKSCKARAWKRQNTKASTLASQSRNRAVCESSLTTTPHIYSHMWAPATSPLRGEKDRAMNHSSSSNRLRDEVSAAPSRARESQNETEPESFERQFVRWVNRDNPQQMPYRPTSLEPKRKPIDPSTVPPANRVLGSLNAVGCDWRCGRDVDSWTALCPTHDDSQPSLLIRRNHDGSVWLKCWAGCSKEAILAALGLEWRDLWEAGERDYDRAKPNVKPLLPAHLRRAMEDLLRLDDERRAA